MFERFWTFFIDSLIFCFMPLVSSYFALSTSVFFNTSTQEASHFEKFGNILLTPAQFTLVAEEAKYEDGIWQFSTKFDYQKQFWIKAIPATILTPVSLIVGGGVKALSFLDPNVRQRHRALVQEKSFGKIYLKEKLYEKLNIDLKAPMESFVSSKALRRPGSENALQEEKKAFQEIIHLLNQANIAWWVDCGTCLGAYRYGGVIPWDEDVDIAVLVDDFENVRRALNALDPKKYLVQDWSSRDFPNSYIKVYIRKTSNLIDIYHFKPNFETKTLQYILSLEENVFFTEWWKIRERRFTVPVAFDTVFPLKKADFDGIEVFVPNNPEKYLQRIYGENLAPAKVYNPLTDAYEKDLSHPYWERAYAH